MTQFLRTPWQLVPAVAALLVLSACGKQEAAAPTASTAAPTSPPVATVNGTPISRAEFDSFLRSLLQGKPVPPNLTAEQKSQVLDQLITMQLLSAQAVKDGADKDPEVTATLDVARMHILADGESQHYLKTQEPTDAELKAEYDSDVSQMDKTEYHARHILVPTKEKAEALIKKIKGGAKFEDVAKAESTDNSKTNGGDLGWFTTNHMVKPFGDAVKNLKKGEMTQEPVQTQYGWHIIKLEDTRDVTPPPFDQVKAQVQKNLIQKKLLAYIDDLKKNAKIEKMPDTTAPAAAAPPAPAASSASP
jgi:peptidyl-prolyl cis-trans isomerase C